MTEKTESAEGAQPHVLEVAGNAVVGGMERYVAAMARFLPEYGWRVTCLAPYESAFTAGLRALGCEVYVTAMEDNPTWRSIQFTSELIRHLGIDLVHAHMPRAHVLAGLAGRLTDVPVAATLHGMDVNLMDLSIARTTGSCLTVVCQAAYAQALGLGVEADRLALIPNGVDLKTFSPHKSGKAFRQTLSIPAGAPLVGFVGRLSYEKGPDQFLQLAQVVARQQPEVHFVLVGDGPMEAELMEMCATIQLQDRVHFAGLWANTAEVYPALDLLVQTSRIEGMPFSLLEAMACARPVAVMGVGGVPEVVEVGTTGVMAAGGDWSGLGDAVLKLLANPDRMRTMGVAGRKRVEDLFDLQNTLRRMSNLFFHMLGRRPSGLVEVPGGNEGSWMELRPTEPAPVRTSADKINRKA